ncbi:MAG: cyclic nucleotide-binding domain-containing protein [Gilvibacter sp.]
MNLLQQFISLFEQHDLWEKEITLTRYEYLKHAGQVNTNLYYMISGSMRAYIIDQDEDQTIRLGYKNNLIGAMDSFVTDSPTNLYLQALKKSRLKRMSKKTLMNFVYSSPEYTKMWCAFLELGIYQQMEREQDILTSSPLERYKRVLKRSPQVFQEIPDKYIASYLRMTPETLSRIKKS